MLARSFRRSARRRRPLLAVLVLCGAQLFASGVALAARAPARPAGVSSSFAGGRLSVTWLAVSGRVEVAVRRPAGARTTVLRRSARGRTGQLTVRLRAVAREAVRVRARRCLGGGGGARRCSRWTPWAVPVVPAAASPAPPITTPGGPTVPGAGAPVGSLVPGTTTPVTTAPGEGPTIGSCPQMPSSWALNQRVDALPLAVKSDAYVRFLGASRGLHPDFGSADLGAGPEGFGIPFRVVPETQPLVRIELGLYADESDPGPFPIPLDTPVEGGTVPGGDRHVLVVREGECKLYELGNASPRDGFWEANVGAIFPLRTGAPRPVGWTSADAAGLPILPLLARYDEAASGVIKHAIRMTAHGIANAYVPPASHFAPTSSSPDAPPMGQRFRLKASYDLSRMTGKAKVIATAMKAYGLVLADTGSDWYVTGAPDRRWDEDDLAQLKGIPGGALEAVDSAPVVQR